MIRKIQSKLSTNLYNFTTTYYFTVDQLRNKRQHRCKKNRTQMCIEKHLSKIACKQKVQAKNSENSTVKRNLEQMEIA